MDLIIQFPFDIMGSTIPIEDENDLWKYVDGFIFVHLDWNLKELDE